MTPEDFKSRLSNLPPDTPITAEHIVAIFSAMIDNPKIDENYSQWDSDKLINQTVLAQWLGESESTIEKWRRKKGDGPDPIFKKGKVSYRVGAVREWLDKITYKSIGEYQAAKSKEKLNKLGLKSFTTEYDSVFPSIYLNHIATPFFDTIRDNEDDYLEMNITGYQTVWTEKDSIASLYLSSHELNIEVDKIIEELLRLKVNGTDLNKLETILINNQAHSINLTHLIALNTYDYDQYTILVKELYSNGLDFHTIDSNGKTSIQLAEENNNMHLCNMINSFDLYKKLQVDIAKK